MAWLDFTPSKTYKILLVFYLLCQLSGAYVKTCPHSCSCDNGNDRELKCLLSNESEWVLTCMDLNKIYGDNDSSLMLDLKFQPTDRAFLPVLNCLPFLNSIDFSNMALKEIPLSGFHNVQINSKLDLSMNNITHLIDETFSALETIHSLNLSNNHIDSLTNKTFKGLKSLKLLDLSYNKLVMINKQVFSELHNLEFLNLAYNKLIVFSTWHFPESLSLRVLNLKANALKQIDLERINKTISPIHYLSTLDISENPLYCSCIMNYLLKTLDHNGQSLDNSGTTTCESPKHLQNLPVLSVNDTDMTCSSPQNIISYPTHKKNVVLKETLHLECRSDGYPAPSIIWITPWGEIFSTSLQSVYPEWRFSNETFLTYKQYEEQNVDVVTTVMVNEKSDLIVSGFRGSISGNFTCIAINIAGNKSEIINLTISTTLKSVYMHSLFIGGYAASGCLIIGFLFGFIKKIILKLSHKMFFTVPIFSKAPSIKPTLETCSSHKDSTDLSEVSSITLDCALMDVSDKDDYCAQSPSGSSPEKRPLHIIESLEEAKDRLRFGMGRKVESMKKNVQSIKHSSSAYVHNIMESGSSAANRMKAGVALGVETVKSHVQSIKELCGTGDMGMQTISMVSVETDIDTNRQTNIVRQITYV